MRALGSATVAVTLALLAAGLTWFAKDGPRLAPAAPTDRARSLPPGLWFVEGHYESNALEDEPRPPRHAVILGVYPSAAGAEAAARRAIGASVPVGLLAPGFPWVVTTRDVPLAGTPPDRIAVVVGLFEDRAAADALARALPRARAVGISPVGFEPQWTDRGEIRLWVVHVDPRRDAHGYEPSAIDAIEQRHASEPAALTAALARLPSCRIPRGTVLATRSSEHYYASSRRFALGRCDGREVRIPVEETLRETVFEYRSDGEVRVHQIVDVSCDTATFRQWRLTTEGREAIDDGSVRRGGCAS